MAIEEFLSNENRISFPTVPTGSSRTAGEFFQRAVITPQNTETIRKWHHLLTRYMNDPEAIILSRLYESRKLDGVWDNRRSMLTRMADGFSYACASNDFARIIFTMAYYDFVPEYRDFKKMMTERKFSLSSSKGLTTVEREHAAFRINPYHKRFYTQGWYLAHIMAFKRDEYMGYPNIDLRDIITLGTKDQWRNNGNYYVRELPNTLSADQKKIAKAQFLRFVDPINYFLVPGKYNSSIWNIGEKDEIVNFMRKKYSDEFGDDYKDFMRKALVGTELIPQENLESLGRQQISVSFGLNLSRQTETGNAPAQVARVVRPRTQRVRQQNTNAVDLNKVRNRIAGWASKTDSKVHKILKAFFAVCRNGKALVRDVEQKCSNARYQDFYIGENNFINSLRSLKTDAGNSYGKVFEQSGDYIKICEEARAIIEEYRDCFS